MNPGHPASPRRGYGEIVALLGLLVLAGSACNERFTFDTTTANAGGSAGAAPGAGATSFAGLPAAAGSQSGAGAGGVGGAGGGGSSGADVAGTSGAAGTAGAAGTCGTRGACPAPLHCADGECAQCAKDADCASYDLARCEPGAHRCVACMETKDCQAGFTCDALAHHCLRSCGEEVDCPPTAHGCDEQRSICYQCDANIECMASSVGTMCAVDGSGCVQCKADTDCPQQHCDPFTSRCVECRFARDCADSGACNPLTGTCLQP